MTADALKQTGRAWVFGHNIPNDAGIMTIEMTRLRVYDPPTLAKACMCGVDPGFPAKAKPGDFIIAGRNFGRGQLHVQGPISINALGLGLLTESISRSFFRLCVAVGVKMMPFCPGILDAVHDGDEIEVDFVTGRVLNRASGKTVQFEPLPPFLLNILGAGGEKAWLKSQAQLGRGQPATQAA